MVWAQGIASAAESISMTANPTTIGAWCFAWCCGFPKRKQLRLKTIFMGCIFAEQWVVSHAHQSRHHGRLVNGVFPPDQPVALEALMDNL